MSRVGRLVLWVKAPRSLRHFNALCRTPVQAQDRLLRQILEANADTEFGRRHGFGAITSFQQFQEQVPISGYEDLEPYITKEMHGRPNQLTKDPPVLFTTTSGTTGNRKYIPMTRDGKRAKAHLTWLWFRFEPSCWAATSDHGGSLPASLGPLAPSRAHLGQRA